MDDVTALRDALQTRIDMGASWIEEYRAFDGDEERAEGYRQLDALIAAAQQEARAGLVEALADIYYRLESAIGNLDGAPEKVVQDVYLTFKAAERAAERAGIIGPDIVASVLDVGATERCAECGHETRWHMDGACACEGDGVAGLCPCPADDTLDVSGWRHVDDCGTPDDDPFCGCTTPTPDPASPCGVPECEHDANATWTHGSSGHPHVPTRCTCGHPIEAVP